MGTFYCGTHYDTANEFFKKEIVNGFNKDVCRVLKSSLRGNTGFVLVESLVNKNEAGENDKTIMIFKIEKSDGEFGYKPFDETSGPFICSVCPASILKMSNNMNERAVAWRESNFKAIEREKEVKLRKSGMVEGQVYRVGKRDVVFKFHYKPSRFAGVEVGTKKLLSFKYDHIEWSESEEMTAA